MKPHDYTGLNNAQCIYVDHFLKRLAHWREQSFTDETRFRIARGEAGRKVELTDQEQQGVDAYIEETVERRAFVELKRELRVEAIECV